MSLFAFFVQAWHCDTVEQMIITTAYEVSAYWSSSIFVFCFLFSLSFFRQIQTIIVIAAVPVMPILMAKDQSIT